MRNSRTRLTHVLALGVALAIAVPVGSSASPTQLPKCLDETPTVVGTPGDDFLVGSSDDDVIIGLGGNDVIAGLAGIDIICGNEGNDEIEGGPDLDGLVGGPGDDTLDGSESEGLDGEDSDLALYLDAPATVQASLSTRTATGEGTDTFVDVEGVVGSAFPDTIEGDAADNVIDGGPGDDHLSAGAGLDYLDVDDGNDTIDGGPGDDLLSYHYAPAPVVVDLARGAATGWGDDTVASVEDLHGSQFADRLAGNGGV